METNLAYSQLPGKTSWKHFWAVMALALIALAGLTAMISKGMVALASTLPMPFTIYADSITGDNFSLVPNYDRSHGGAISVIKMDQTLHNMTITKSVSIAGHTLSLNISAGSGSPVQGSGVLVDASDIQAGVNSFDGMVMDANSGISAKGITLKDATLQVPYLSADSMTLPDMHLSVSMK
ncbi:DUF6230 family protein [Alicyclobacillus herbarius]|uniref:DUF6230 family protein n=1 Tax=Alicyclobacillus herbarius TaxID=122960 RepID=UPI00041DF283|nr:DUF6230 family protein [Alicyclobacillus herbarius]